MGSSTALWHTILMMYLLQEGVGWREELISCGNENIPPTSTWLPRWFVHSSKCLNLTTTVVFIYFVNFYARKMFIIMYDVCNDHYMWSD